MATWEADHPTLKYAAKNHFFQALLCHLCSDLVCFSLVILKKTFGVCFTHKTGSVCGIKEKLLHIVPSE